METKKQSSEDDKRKIIYQCPMRCEEKKKYNHPGNCPVCNMKLVKVNNPHQFQHFFG